MYHFQRTQSTKQWTNVIFREFENGVQTLEDEAKEGRLDNAMVFLCTDNSTTEAGWYKGNSSSKKLFDLKVRLRKL